MPETIVMKEIKISKLFHLLYATLLLAPVFAVGVACAQTAFTGTGVVSQPNELGATFNPSQSGGEKDKWYFIDLHNTVTGSTMYYGIDIAWQDDATSPIYYFANVDSGWFQVVEGSHFLGIETWAPSVSSQMYYESFYWLAFRPHFTQPVETEGNGGFALTQATLDDLNKIPTFASSTGYQDIFYTSVDKVSQSPFFNWAEKSFLGDGFRYMGNIFGMPTDNPFYTFTCYWCAISILWLIFDVVMYVPKLAHRWLDKGAIE